MSVAERHGGAHPLRRADKAVPDRARAVQHQHARAAVGVLVALAGLGVLVDPPGLGTQVVILALAVGLLGLPHGAVDGLGGAAAFERLTGGGWASFVAFYLGLAALVLAVWIIAPVVMLFLFLALATWHFGGGDAAAAGAGSGAIALCEVAARGGLPIVLPVALYPSETGTLFAWLADSPGLAVATQAYAGPALAIWASFTLAAIAGRIWRGAGLGGVFLAEFAALITVFVLWPPLLAFAAYFTLVHAPRHLLAIDPGTDSASFLRPIGRLTLLGLPLTAVTLAGAGLGFWLLGGAEAPLTAGLKTLFWGLSALTVPHMALEVFGDRD